MNLNNWEVDSAALRDYHLGQTPDERALVTLRGKGIINYSHKAKLITKEDFNSYDWIFGMDEFNIKELVKIKPEISKAKIELLGSYYPDKVVIIRDPFADNNCQGFVEAYDQCNSSIKNFLSKNNLIT
ncbi:low molecular weight phosphotyrosine protein phosphatase-like [Microplitis mediator]|uniref:low molecular weight phosphotyrosine protein phosphatase-like n=1 Tax=Microplitis mediator TaxID=375433 RepID=UPI00255326A8|nr:low molecular weight phosphotyrosine protein phosphatase-like [Microplitis mediator]